MAATGTPTPNIGLRIPQGTDPASVDDINYNSNLLDTKLGAVGNTSVQDQIDSLNGKIFIYEIGSVTTDAAGLFQLSEYTTPWSYAVLGAYRSAGGNSPYIITYAGHTSNVNTMKVLNRGDMSAVASTTISDVRLIMMKL